MSGDDWRNYREKLAADILNRAFNTDELLVSGNWYWDSATNTWLIGDDTEHGTMSPEIEALYPKPEPKLTSEDEQSRLWELLKQAAGG